MGKGSECDPTIWIKEGMFKQTWLIKNLGFRAMKGFQSLWEKSLRWMWKSVEYISLVDGESNKTYTMESNAPEKMMQILSCLRNDKKREDKLPKFRAQYIPQAIMKITTNIVK